MSPQKSLWLAALQCRKDQADDNQHRPNRQRPVTVTSFKYLHSAITNEGCMPEILSRIAQTTAALTRLKPVWIDESIYPRYDWCAHPCHIGLPVWTLTAALQRKQTMEMRRYCKTIQISGKDHVTNADVHAKIRQAIGPHKDLPTIVKRCIFSIQ